MEFSVGGADCNQIREEEAVHMSVEQNKAIARRFLQAWCSGDLDAIDEMAVASFVYNNPAFPKVTGRETFKKAIAGFRSHWSDSAINVEEEIAEDDKVVMRWCCSGTHQGSSGGLPPTGKKVSWTGITIYHLTEGKIVEQTDVEDRLGQLRQIGDTGQHRTENV
jgi:steroid delta-isomerase-like uncharacterized protein